MADNLNAKNEKSNIFVASCEAENRNEFCSMLTKEEDIPRASLSRNDPKQLTVN